MYLFCVCNGQLTLTHLLSSPIVECDLCKGQSVTNLPAYFLDVSTNNLTLQDAVDEALSPDIVREYECKE